MEEIANGAVTVAGGGPWDRGDLFLCLGDEVRVSATHRQAATPGRQKKLRQLLRNINSFGTVKRP